VKYTILILFSCLFLGCNNDSSQDLVSVENECDNPIEILGTNQELGYLVGVESDYEASLIATEYIEEFDNEINIYTTVHPYFAAEMSPNVLAVMQCDTRIDSIQYESESENENENEATDSMPYPSPSKISPNHSLIADFTSLGTGPKQWELSSASASSLTLDNTYTTDLSTSTRLDWNIAASGDEDSNIELRYDLGGSLDASSIRTIGVLMYIEGADETALDAFDYNGIKLKLVSDTETWWNHSKQYDFMRGGAGRSSTQQQVGWFWATVYADDFSREAGTFDPHNVRKITLTINSSASSYPASMKIHLHKIVIDPVPNRVPNIYITFDDTAESHYTEAFSYMQPLGLKGTLFAIQDMLGTAGKMSLANLKEHHDAGWAVGYHGSGRFPNFFAMTPTERDAAITAWFAFCETNGITRGIYTGAYPHSQHNRLVRQELYDRGFKAFRIGADWNVNFLTPFVGSGYNTSPVNPAGGFGFHDPLQVPSSMYNPDSAENQIDVNYLVGGGSSQFENILVRGRMTSTDQVITYHELVASGATGTQVNRADFQAHMDILKRWEDLGLISIRTFDHIYSD